MPATATVTVGRGSAIDDAVLVAGMARSYTQPILSGKRNRFVQGRIEP